MKGTGVVFLFYFLWALSAFGSAKLPAGAVPVGSVKLTIVRSECKTALTLFADNPAEELQWTKNWNELANPKNHFKETVTYRRVSSQGKEVRTYMANGTHEDHLIAVLDFTGEFEEFYESFIRNFDPGKEKAFAVEIDARPRNGVLSEDVMVHVIRHGFGFERRYDGSQQRLDRNFEEKYFSHFVSGTVADFMKGKNIIVGSIMAGRDTTEQYVRVPVATFIDWFNRINRVRGWYIDPEIVYKETVGKKSDERVEFRTTSPKEAELKRAAHTVEVELKVYQFKT